MENHIKQLQSLHSLLITLKSNLTDTRQECRGDLNFETLNSINLVIYHIEMERLKIEDKIRDMHKL